MDIREAFSTPSCTPLYARTGVLNLVDELADRVATSRQVRTIALAGCPGRLSRARRRGRRWSEFPLLAEPPVRFVEDEWGRAEVREYDSGEWSESHVTSAAGALAGAKVVVLGLLDSVFATLDPAVEAAALVRAHQALSHVREGRPLCDVVLLRIGRPPVLTDLDGLASMTAHDRARVTFDGLYALNAQVVLGRLMSEVFEAAEGVVDIEPDAVGAHRSLPVLASEFARGEIGPLSRPLALQALFRLQAAGAAGLPLVVRGEEELDPRLSNRGPLGVNGGAWLRRLARTPVEDEGLVWCGSGKWDGLALDAEDVYYLCKGLQGDRLIEVQDDAVRLSPMGDRLLEALHPDMEDPDLPLRWVGDRANPEAMSSWLLRNFRKVKDRMAADEAA